MPPKKVRPSATIKDCIKKLSADEKKLHQDEKNIHKTVQALQESGIGDFVSYLESPKRIIWTNLLAGIFRGLGILIGMTVVVGVLGWMIAYFVDFPLIGNYFKDLKILLEGISLEGSIRP